MAIKAGQPERSAIDLIKDVVGNIQGIIRAELRLARAEIAEKASGAGKGAALIAAGAIAGLYGLAFLLVSLHTALSAVMPPALSALCIGAVLTGLGMGLAMAGRKKVKSISSKPEKTIHSVREDVQVLQAHRGANDHATPAPPPAA